MTEHKIESVEEYLLFVEKYKGVALFRGQANATWCVEPSIFRDEDELKCETSTLDIKYNSTRFDVLSQLLEKQHYGTKTRLCDLTINPLVALYFSIEDETCDENDSCVYIFDKSKSVSSDSLEVSLLLLLATTPIHTLQELKNQCKILDIKTDYGSINDIISKNYIIDYNYNFSYTNTRSFLQGGTGILYGFSIMDGNIIRKGTLDIDSQFTRVIIPAKSKSIIRDTLRIYGICKEVLYDEVHTHKPLSYSVSEVHQKTAIAEKIILNISVSDVMFEQSDIEKIIDEIYKMYRKDFGSKALIFGYVYFDEQDKRNFNWIAMPQLKSDIFDLKYNPNYHKRRMDFLNKEISINSITSLTEPIVERCRQFQKQAELLLREYFENNRPVDDYLAKIKINRSRLYKLIYFDLQDIEHGAKQYDDYYNLSNEYCLCVDELLEHQEQCNVFDQLISKMSIDTKKCNAIFEDFEKAKNKLSNDVL